MRTELLPAVLLVVVLAAADDAPPRLRALERRAPFDRSPVLGVWLAKDMTELAVSADARVWRSTGAPGKAQRGPWPDIGCIAFSPDGRVAFVGQMDDSVWRWDLSTNEARRSAPSHAGPVCAVAFTSDGRLAATGS